MVRAEIVTESHTPVAMVLPDRGLILIHRCGRERCRRCRATACPRKLAAIVVGACRAQQVVLDPVVVLAEVTRALFAPLADRLGPDVDLAPAMTLAASHWPDAQN